MHAALLSMGFTPTVQIVKTRRIGRWGEVTVCVDAVDGLGTFLELETMADDQESGADAQERLHVQATSLGIAMERVGQTYDSLLRAAARPQPVA